MQKVDPPAQVIDAFRDVQAARADLERAQNEAQTYANRVVPEARGRAAQIVQSAEAYREQTVAEANGPGVALQQVYEQYKKAPDVTRERLYLETMERIFGGTDKVILDTAQGRPGRRAVPAAQRIAATGRRRAPGTRHASGRQPMRTSIAGGVAAVVVVVVADSRLRLAVHGACRPGRRWWYASAIRVQDASRAGPPREMAADRERHLHRQAHPRSRNLVAGSDLRPTRSGSWSMLSRAIASTDPLKFYQSVGSIEGANSRLSTLLNSALRRVLGEATLTHVVRDDRAAADGAGARAARPRG